MILGYQAMGWLVHGYWIGMPFSAFCATPAAEVSSRANAVWRTRPGDRDSNALNASASGARIGITAQIRCAVRPTFA
jgi:hypothetical protein